MNKLMHPNREIQNGESNRKHREIKMAKPKYKNMDKKPPTVASVSKIRLKTQYIRTQQ